MTLLLLIRFLLRFLIFEFGLWRAWKILKSVLEVSPVALQGSIQRLNFNRHLVGVGVPEFVLLATDLVHTERKVNSSWMHATLGFDGEFPTGILFWHTVLRQILSLIFHNRDTPRDRPKDTLVVAISPSQL